MSFPAALMDFPEDFPEFRALARNSYDKVFLSSVI